MRMHEKNIYTLEMHFMYLATKIFTTIINTFCIIAALFSTKYYVYFTILSLSVQTILPLFITHALSLNTNPVV